VGAWGRGWAGSNGFAVIADRDPVSGVITAGVGEVQGVRDRGDDEDFRRSERRGPRWCGAHAAVHVSLAVDVTGGYTPGTAQLAATRRAGQLRSRGRRSGVRRSGVDRGPWAMCLAGPLVRGQAGADAPFQTSSAHRSADSASSPSLRLPSSGGSPCVAGEDLDQPVQRWAAWPAVSVRGLSGVRTARQRGRRCVTRRPRRTPQKVPMIRSKSRTLFAEA